MAGSTEASALSRAAVLAALRMETTGGLGILWEWSYSWLRATSGLLGLRPEETPGEKPFPAHPK
ncbi:mCG60780, isoform CRA_b [Mus musculus]|nr:mCG60780, isoform CRA_b [Mus musculus]